MVARGSKYNMYTYALIIVIPICFNNYYRLLEDEVKKFNLGLADEQKKEQEFLNNIVYKTKASDEFFEQFNKTTR